MEEEGGWGAVYCSSSVYKSAETNKKFQDPSHKKYQSE